MKKRREKKAEEAGIEEAMVGELAQLIVFG